MKRVLIVFIIFLTGVGIIIYLNLDWQNNRKLPVFQPNDINPELVDSSLHGRGRGIDGGDHIISEFELLDQLNQKITKKIMLDKIVLVDFFFVSCPSICPYGTPVVDGCTVPYGDTTVLLIVALPYYYVHVACSQ